MRSFDASRLPMLIVCLLPLAAAVAVGVITGSPQHAGVGALATIIRLVALSCVTEVVVHERVGYGHTLAALRPATDGSITE